MKKKLIITLKSDLCVASGYSYAGVVDSDICYDKYGLPYIPARRLKGCFRDTAENLLYNFINKGQIEELFGVSGANNSGSLRISNARLRNYEEIKQEIIALRENPTIGHLFTQQRVLEQYTHIVAQTAIGEDSAAEDRSLRYTRVVNHYVPEANGNNYAETVFEAVIEYADNWANKAKEQQDERPNDIGTAQALRLIVGATKNIGLKRNRGFGLVVCQISDMCDVNVPEESNADFLSDEEYVISYTLINDEPLMLSQLSDTHSVQYISGQTMLGHLAGAYIKKAGTTTESKEFQDLFLNGTTKYVNAYVSTIDRDGKVCTYYPAPANINKLKKTNDYVDTFYPVPEDKNQAGNQPKKLKGKFLYQDISDTTIEIDIKEVDMKLHYHHRKGDDSILYPAEAIEPDQIFAGEIYTNKKYVKTLIEMLDHQDFYFGKSKAAQYGHCECIVRQVQPVNALERRQYHGEILITLLTDAIFCDENEYTVKVDTIAGQICKCIDGATAAVSKSRLETGLVSGYQTTWNMHKPLYPVVKAGSCFVLNCPKISEVPDRIWVGTKNQEGYGYASVTPMAERVIKLKELETRAAMDTQITKFAGQYCSILKQGLLEELLVRSIDLNGITKTQISRAILMLKQSKDFADFKNRVNSIKTDSVRITFNDKLIKPIAGENGADISKLINGDPEAETYYELLKQDAFDLSDLWKDYLLYNLTLCKYQAKEA